jgi:PTH1 family peptidyl-tRNA hydrolase
MFGFKKKTNNSILIVGLGNPGLDYERSRHNSGFLFVNKLAGVLSEKSELSHPNFNLNSKLETEIFEINYKGKKIYIAKPQTFMNDSGRSVSKIMNYYKLSADNLFVAYDDLDLQIGAYKIQKGKYPKSHNGLNSIMNALKTSEFTHIRIGIENRDNDKFEGKDFVLSRFSEEEFEKINEVLGLISDEVISSHSLSPLSRG